MNRSVVSILFSLLLVSCETPQGVDYTDYKYTQFGTPDKGRTVKSERERPKTFEDDFTERMMDEGLSSAVNGAVSANYGAAECQKRAPWEEVEGLEDASKIDEMILTAFDSDPSCKKVFTGNKGNTTTAGLPYAKTFAYSMIQDMCNPSNADIGNTLSEPSLSSKDAMSLGLFNKGSKSSKSVDNLATTYALMFALGQREADGNFKEGRDMAANNKSAVTEEAGLFQVSANSLNLGTGKKKQFLRGIFKSFVDELSSKSSSEKGKLCLVDKVSKTKETRRPASANDLQTLFSSGLCRNAKSNMKEISFSSSKVSGCFRNLTKSCPSFAIKYGAGVARINRHHNGPLITHTEFRKKGYKSSKFYKPYVKPACHGVFRSIASNKEKICKKK